MRGGSRPGDALILTGRLILISTLAAVAITACGSGHQYRPGNTSPPPQDPFDRAVRLETEGCGLEPPRTGSGVLIDDGMILTVAHLVARAESVSVFMAGHELESVSVAAVDRQRDLAILRVPPDGTSQIETSSVAKGASGSIVEGSGSGSVPFVVKGVVELTIEEVLGTTRHSRRGYELAAVTGAGDSGAGAYDEDDRLIGIVFATGRDGATTWVTSSSEIADFLSTVSPSDFHSLCDERPDDG